MGHFGKVPIRAAWIFVVMPALVLNYFGEGAMLIENPMLGGITVAKSLYRDVRVFQRQPEGQRDQRAQAFDGFLYLLCFEHVDGTQAFEVPPPRATTLWQFGLRRF